MKRWGWLPSSDSENPPWKLFFVWFKREDWNPRFCNFGKTLRKKEDLHKRLVRAREEPLSITPSSALTATFSPGRWISYALITVDSATPGKPFVQNDIRVRDEPLTMDVAVQGQCAEWDKGEKWALKKWIFQPWYNPSCKITRGWVWKTLPISSSSIVWTEIILAFLCYRKKT